MVKQMLQWVAGVAGLVALLVLFILALLVTPLPLPATIAEAYWLNPWGTNTLQQQAGLMLVVAAKWWPVWGFAALGLVAVWLWVRGGRSEEVEAYVQHAHALEVALKQSREQADVATGAWDRFNANLDGLFSTTAELFLVAHPINGVRRWNQPAMALAKRHNPGLTTLEGRSVADVVGSDLLRQMMQKAIETGKPLQGEIQIGTLAQWFLAWVVPMENEAMVVLRDVTSLHATGGALQQSGELVLRQVIEESVRPVALVDDKWRYLCVSHKWAETLGLPTNRPLIGVDHWEVSPSFPANKGVVLQQLADGQLLGQREERLDMNGREATFSWFIRPWKDAGGRLGGYLFGVQDVTELHRLKQQVAQAEDRENQLAYADALTGLPNRQLFNDRLTVALAQAYRQLGKIAILFLDLDGFKAVNDKLGHAAGDLLLKQVAERLKTCVRTSDTLARLGGDEFTMILNIREPRDAEQVAQKVLESIRQPYDLNGQVADKVGTSIGIALYPQHGAQAGDLIKAADNAMYAAKEGGKNTYRFAGAEKKD